MKYMGSKNRHAKSILEIILQHRASGDQFFVEPFVGGANIVDKVTGLRLCADINPYLIALRQAVAKGWLPPEKVSEEEYNEVKNNPGDFEPRIVGYFGFALSYGGKWFGGWCRDGAGRRNYVAEAYRNAVKQFPALRGVLFEHTPYDELLIPGNSLIYCDPPYAGATKYAAGEKQFDHDIFWAWVRRQSENNIVFVSEYSAPEDFECVWSKEVNSSLDKNTGGKKNVEKLFRWCGDLC